jgi:ABC-2 type transport system permease protein
VRDTLTLYVRFAGICLRSKMQYRASFLLMSAGQFFSLIMEFLAIWALFARFGSLKGWSLPEIALFYGVTHGAFGVAEIIGRGFDTFSDMVKSGDFDRFLVRPRSTTLQVAGREFDGRIGRLVQSLAVFCWGLSALHVAWSVPKALVVVAMFLGAVCIFYGLFVLQAALSFWTVDGLEIMNAVTYGGTETGQYPLTIYRPWFRSIFTFVIPLACVNYLPAGLVFGRTATPYVSAPLLALCPAAGLLFLGFTLLCWRIGVRHYCSTGS